MESANAAPTARGYSRRFLRELKIGYRDFILAVSAGIIAPLVARFGFHKTGAEVAVVSAVIASILVFLGDSAYKVCGLLWASYKRLQDVLPQLDSLKLELEIRKRWRVEAARDAGDFLWANRQEETSAFWENARIDWCERTVNAIADFLEIGKETAENRLYDWPAMPSSPSQTERLRQHLNNLKGVISSAVPQ